MKPQPKKKCRDWNGTVGSCKFGKKCWFIHENINSEGDDSFIHSLKVLGMISFRIAFDQPTPRSRFILLPQDKTDEKKINLSSMQASTLKSIVSFVEDVTKTHGLEPSVLSFHTGFFQSTHSPGFHGHICTSTEKVFEILDSGKKESLGWVDNFSPTAQWVEKKSISNETLVDLFKKNVKAEINRVQKDGEGYWSSDFEKVAFSEIQANNCESFEDCRLLFHPIHAKIGFILKVQSQDFLTLTLQTMIKFANSKELFQVQSGCHICVRFSSTWGMYDESSDFGDLFGYIHVLPELFFKLNPNREVWLENFRKHHSSSKSINIIT